MQVQERNVYVQALLVAQWKNHENNRHQHPKCPRPTTTAAPQHLWRRGCFDLGDDHGKRQGRSTKRGQFVQHLTCDTQTHSAAGSAKKAEDWQAEALQTCKRSSCPMD
jgi:hypothetical protein